MAIHLRNRKKRLSPIVVAVAAMPPALVVKVQGALLHAVGDAPIGDCSREKSCANNGQAIVTLPLEGVTFNAGRGIAS